MSRPAPAGPTRSEPRSNQTGSGPGLYVHVPFCEAKCSYCDFYSVASGDAPGHRFVEALEAEASRRVPAEFAPETAFVGGGTPTALSDPEFERMLALVGGLVRRGDHLREWTVECNPNSLSASKASAMVRAGVTRASIGVQSFDDEILRSVGRVHDASEARAAVEIARSAGISQISVDLLFAIPGQGLETFRRDLDEALRLGTDHVSAYALLYEEGTNITSRRDRGLVSPELEDAELAMMRLAREVLGDAGFERYEISNFARPGAACLHNLNYWRNGEYLGLGPSAVTYLGGERRATVASWRTWQRSSLAGTDAVASTERLPPSQAAAEELMVRLRLTEGARMSVIEKRFGAAVREPLIPLLRRLQDEGLVELDEALDHVAISGRGVEVADGILVEILATVAATESP